MADTEGKSKMRVENSWRNVLEPVLPAMTTAISGQIEEVRMIVEQEELEAGKGGDDDHTFGVGGGDHTSRDPRQPIVNGKELSKKPEDNHWVWKSRKLVNMVLEKLRNQIDVDRWKATFGVELDMLGVEDVFFDDIEDHFSVLLQEIHQLWKLVELVGEVPEKLVDELVLERWEATYGVEMKKIDQQNVSFGDVEDPPVVKEGFAAGSSFLACNLVLQSLDRLYQLNIQRLNELQEMLNGLKNFHDPLTDESGIAAWVQVDEGIGYGEYLILDSGATEHFFREECLLSNTKVLLEPKSIQCANGESMNLEKCGEVVLKLGKDKVLTLRDAFAHSDFAQNLLSIRRLVKDGYEVVFDDLEARVCEKKSGKLIFAAPFDGKMWKVKVDVIKSDGQALLIMEGEKGEGSVVKKDQSKESGKSSTKSRKRKIEETEEERAKRRKIEEQKEDLGILWHYRLGHPNTNYLKFMAKEVENMKKATFGSKVDNCEDCLRAKFARQPCKKTRGRAERPLQIIHSDVACAFPKSLRNSRTMVVTFIDDYSRYASVYSIQKKSDVKDMFKLFVDETKREFGDKYSIGTLRCDNGTEYINWELKDYCRERGIEVDPCPPYTSQLNGVAERFNRTLQNKIRALLFNSGYPTSMWEYAAGVATYTYNRLPNKANKLESPFYRYYGEEPDISNIRRFGCVVWTRNTDPERRKEDPKGVPRFLVGYTSTGYNVLNPETNGVSSIKHAHHVESKVYGDYKKLKPDDYWKSWEFLSETNDGVVWMEKEKANEIEDEEAQIPEGVTSSSVATVGAGSLEGERTEKSANKGVESDDSDYELEEVEVMSCDSDEEGNAYMTSKVQSNPDTIAEALRRPDRKQWKQAIKEEYMSIKERGTFVVVDIPKGANIIDSKWVLTVKRTPEGPRYKARLVARGFKLKRKYEQYQTFAPVATMGVVRILLAVANELGLPIIQMDVKSAFLNGKLDEEVYMYIPSGFTEEEKHKKSKVLLLLGALYGLPISPKKWNERFHQVMEDLGMVQDGAEPCLYIWRENEDFVALTLYVDDMLMTGTKKEMLDKVKRVLKENFDIKVLGEPKKFLGVEVDRNIKKQTLKIHQTEYINEIVEKYSIGKKKVAPTPMLPQDSQHEVTDGEVRGYEKLHFRGVVGSLGFIANATRPDISYAVNQLSRNQENPELSDWRLMKRIVDYLRGSSQIGITYRKENKKGEEIECYVDASFASDKVDRKSTSGYFVKVYGNTIAWKSKKQEGVSTSSTEAEYIALSDGSKEARIWSGILERSIGVECVPVVYEDNRPAECLAKSKKTGKLRHVEIKFHFVKDLAAKGKLDIRRIDTKNQTADFLTKPLAVVPFRKCRMECMNETPEIRREKN